MESNLKSEFKPLQNFMFDQNLSKFPRNFLKVIFVVAQKMKKRAFEEEKLTIVQMLLEKGAKLEYQVEDIPSLQKRQQFGIQFNENGNFSRQFFFGIL